MELTNKDINVIIYTLNDLDNMCGLTREERELKEKLERWMTEND